ncbi:hypothetical protein DFQ29_000515, partial [Apophysomyces sp. BC1021]
MNFQHYVDTRTEAYDDGSSDEEMDLESPAFAYGKLIDLADANTIITPNIKNENMPDAPEVSQRKYTLQVYKKYGE